MAAVAALVKAGLRVERVSRVRATAPMGPGGRRFANAVLAARWGGDARALLALVKSVERDFGRRGAQRWGDRVLDLDVLALGDVVVRERGWPGVALVVPHAGLAVRRFVLAPLVEVAPGWRHPVLGLTARQLHVRALRPKRAPLRVGP